MKSLIIIILFSSLILAQNDSLKNAFDFWLGEWYLEWTDSQGGKGSGKNYVFKILNENVIYENFSAESGSFKGFLGKSWSVYNQQTNEWKQTWVDNQGSYLDFYGIVKKDVKIFQRESTNKAGKTILQRMVFKNIMNDSFIWDWESSSDGGKSWNLNWQIKYTRIKHPVSN